MTCERQRGIQRHMMDAETKEDRLELLEPQVEDGMHFSAFLE